MKLGLWHFDDLLSLSSAPLLQWTLQAASCSSFEPERCGTNPAEQSCRGLLWIFESLLSHRGLKWSLCWSRSACPPSLSFRVPREGLKRSNPCPPDPLPAGNILLSSCQKLPGNLIENPSKSWAQSYISYQSINQSYIYLILRMLLNFQPVPELLLPQDDALQVGLNWYTFYLQTWLNQIHKT